MRCPSSTSARLALAFLAAILTDLICCEPSAAKTLLASEELQGHEIEPGDLLTIRELHRDGEIVVADASPVAGRIVSSKAWVVLEIQPYGPDPLTSPLQAELKLALEYAGVSGSREHRAITLAVDYAPSSASEHREKALWSVEGAAFLAAEVASLEVTDENGEEIHNEDVLGRLTLRAAVQAEHHHDVDGTEAPRPRVHRIERGSIQLSWSPVSWAESYELEWTHVDDYDGGGLYGEPVGGLGRFRRLSRPPSVLPYDFRFNSTRIPLQNTFYSLPRVFERGYLLWRVRAVGRAADDPEQPVAGRWSAFRADKGEGFDPTAPEVVHVDDRASHASDIVIGPEGDAVRDELGSLIRSTALNWQQVVSFAEGGRRQDVVRYLDGTLRERQTVTKRNTDDALLVGETIYDHRGRSAVDMLPVPARKDNGLSPPIGYQRNFNVTRDGRPYTYRDFEVDRGGGPVARPLGSGNGAGHYYSPANREQVGHQAYVPDAQGYPFMRRTYTPDETGRFRAEGAPGPDHQIGSGHETKYFYGVPDQEELDRLFGNDAGFTRHYKKRMTVDPDGQVTIAYLDPQGRLVATALAGRDPAALLPVTDPLPVITTTFDLLEDDQLSASDPRSLRSAKTILVTDDETDYSFVYRVEPPKAHEENTCAASSVCYDCAYELDIQVVNATTGAVEFPDAAHAHEWPRRIGSLEELGVCDAAAPDPVEIAFTVTLGRGSYRIIKTLRVSEPRIDAVAADFVKEDRNACLAIEREDLLATLTDGVDLDSCEPSCRECEFETLQRTIPIEVNGERKDLEFTVEEQQDIGALCTRSCGVDPVAAPCDAAYKAMLADVSPGGQYALYSDPALAPSEDGFDPFDGGPPADREFRPNDFELSVLNPRNKLPWDNADWQHPLIPYEERGAPSRVRLSEGNFDACRNGSPEEIARDGCFPQDLTAEAFVQHWRPDWARSLVGYHPEYGYYEWCRAHEGTEAFPARLRAVEKFEAATAWSSGPLSQPRDLTTAEGLIAADPFLSTEPRRRRMRNEMKRFERNLTSGGEAPTPFTIIETVHLAVRCNNPLFTQREAAACARDAGPIGSDRATRDTEWRYLREFYLSRRADVVYEERRAFIDGEPAYFRNDCIGVERPRRCDGAVAGSAYPEKTKRYPDNRQALDLLPDTDFPTVRDWNEQRLYERCGKCPLQSELEALLSAAAMSGRLTKNFALPSFPVIPGQRLLATFSGPRPIDNQYKWRVQVDADQLDIAILSPRLVGPPPDPRVFDFPVGRIQLRKPPGSPSWANIRWFMNLRHNAAPVLFDASAGENFTVRGLLRGDCPIHVENGCVLEIEGLAEGLDFRNCDLSRLCEPEQTANQLARLARFILRPGRLESSSLRLRQGVLGDHLRAFGERGDRYFWRFDRFGDEADPAGPRAFTAQLFRGTSANDEFGATCELTFRILTPGARFDSATLPLTDVRPQEVFRAAHEPESSCASQSVVLRALNRSGSPIELLVTSACHTLGQCCVRPSCLPAEVTAGGGQTPIPDDIRDILHQDDFGPIEIPPIEDERIANLLQAVLAPRLSDLPACDRCSFPISPRVPYRNTCPDQKRQDLETALGRA